MCSTDSLWLRLRPPSIFNTRLAVDLSHATCLLLSSKKMRMSPCVSLFKSDSLAVFVYLLFFLIIRLVRDWPLELCLVSSSSRLLLSLSPPTPPPHSSMPINLKLEWKIMCRRMKESKKRKKERKKERNRANFLVGCYFICVFITVEWTKKGIGNHDEMGIHWKVNGIEIKTRWSNDIFRHGFLVRYDYEGGVGQRAGLLWAIMYVEFQIQTWFRFNHTINGVWKELFLFCYSNNFQIS